MDNLAEIVGPLGVLVVVVAWAILSRRTGNGRAEVVITKINALQDDVREMRDDVRELRASLVRHLEDHAHS